MQKNDLIGKIRLISKFLASQPGKQAISIHILPSISKSKGNQTMKFGQLVEHHMRNILLEKSLKNQNSGYIWINILNFNSVGFIASPSR